MDRDDIPKTCPCCGALECDYEKYGWSVLEVYYTCGTIISIYFGKLDFYGTHANKCREKYNIKQSALK